MLEGIGRLVETIRRGEGTPPPLLTRIDNTHVDVGNDLLPVFEPGKHYFTVRVNEMFLHYGRKWSTEFLPMTWVLTEYTYGYGDQALPCMVGPSMVKDKAPGDGDVPGMLFRDIRVAGVQPYRGGRLSLSLVLYQVPIRDHVERVLSALQAASNVLDFSGQLAPYLKVVDALSNTARDLLDLKDTTPLIGAVHQFEPDAGDPMRPGFYTMVRDDSISSDELWVKDKCLLVGDTRDSAQPLRSTDYVLYSIMATTDRTDADRLAFIEPLWQRVVRFAGRTDDDSWETARANFAVLGEELYLSPDLTTTQAEALYDGFETQLTAMRERAKRMGDLGEAADLDDDMVVLRNIVSRVRAID